MAERRDRDNFALGVDYDSIGAAYSATRRTDPRIARALLRALGDACTVVNVGAGAGAYEPADRAIVAVEPSSVMIGQRPATAAKAVRASAERLPFPDASFDAAMAVLSDHHWSERARGLREMRRVARRRVVLFNADPAAAERFWLTRDYLPAFLDLIPTRYRSGCEWERELREILGDLTITAVPIPHDCEDGFYGAYWRRPAAYLDARVRAGISVFARLGEEYVDTAIARLRDDLASGLWSERHRDLLDCDELDLGYRIVRAELTDR